MLMVSNLQLMREAKETLKGRWTNLVIANLLVMVITAAAGAILNIGAVLVIFLSAPLAVGLCAYLLDFNGGTTDEVSVLFRSFKNGYTKTIIAGLLMLLYIFLWSLLFVIPGIIMTYAYSMTYYILADDDTISGQDALRKSKDMMKGFKMKLFLLQLRFFGWILLSIITFGIGFIWVIPYMKMAETKFYLDVKANYQSNVACSCGCQS